MKTASHHFFLRAAAVCLMLLGQVFAAPKPTPLPTAPWHIPDAPYRVSVRLITAPTLPEAGVEINVPECGLARPDLADLLLVDRNGEPQPIAKIGRRAGGRLLLLAQKLDPKTPYFLYFGGNKLRNATAWNPTVSLLMETKPAPPDLKFDTLQDWQTAWTHSPEEPGAAFVERIFHAGNPFGANTLFLTHYTGYVRVSPAKEITFYTLSSDCSFVSVNNQSQFGWPGRHSPRSNQNTAPQKAVSCAEGLVKIDYYAAKGAVLPDENYEAAMVLGWKSDSGYKPIPPEAWIHPGATQVSPIQNAEGQWLPQARASVGSYVGFVNQWLFEIYFELRPTPTEEGWSVVWEFEDGAMVSGVTGKRILTGRDSQLLKCKLTHNGVTQNQLFRIDIPDQLQRASINDPADVRRYIEMIVAEAGNKLKPEAVRARLAFLCETGTDQDIAKFAATWPETNRSDSLWLPSRLASVRAHAQVNPAKASQEFRSLIQSTPENLKQIFAQELAETEMELMVFCLRDPGAVGRLNQIAFQTPSADLKRTAMVRIGDLYRLLGRYKEATVQYQSLATKGDDLALPVKDSAASIAIRDLLDKGFGKHAAYKLNEWELRRPLAKFDTDFLLLQARVLLILGRWSEAEAELGCFQRVQPDSPFQIDAQYYLARALYEKGDKEAARKIWNNLAKEYPKHPLTPKAREWAQKP